MTPLETALAAFGAAVLLILTTLSEDNVSIFFSIYLWMDTFCYCRASFSWNMCRQTFKLLPSYTSLSKTVNKCAWILTSVFKSIIPLSYSASGVTQKALKRLNRSEQEPDRMAVILCQCCFDIVRTLVETNHLGLIEKLINRQRGTKRNP